jgi:membrane-associated phospholipid phosphatase
VTTKLATILSYVLHPLLMSTYLFTSLVFVAPHNILPIGYNPTGSIVLISLIFVTTFIIPVLSLFILKLSGSISSLSLDKKEERITPMIYTTVMYAVTTYLFTTKVELGDMISVFLGISTLLIGITAVITFFWKISLHGIGVGGFVGFVMGLNQQSTLYHFEFVLPLLFLVSAIMLSARLKLNAHNPKQVYLGFVLGIFVSFVSFIIYLI